MSSLALATDQDEDSPSSIHNLQAERSILKKMRTALLFQDTSPNTEKHKGVSRPLHSVDHTIRKNRTQGRNWGRTVCHRFSAMKTETRLQYNTYCRKEVKRREL